MSGKKTAYTLPVSFPAVLLLCTELCFALLQLRAYFWLPGWLLRNWRFESPLPNTCEESKVLFGERS